MNKKIIPLAGDLPLSQAVLVSNKHFMEISGQIGLNSATKKLEKGVEEQTARIMDSIKKILNEVNWDFENIIKTRIFLVDMQDYSKVNEVYARYFSKNYPARVALAVKELPLGALVEIECTAAGDRIS